MENTDTLDGFRKWLKTELEKKNWSYGELARQTGRNASQPLISLIMAGERSVTWDFCAAIAVPLGYSPIEVFRIAGLPVDGEPTANGRQSNDDQTRRKFKAWLDQGLSDRGWSIRELSRNCNFTFGHIANIARGIKPVTWDVVADIAGAFNQYPEDAFREVGLLPASREQYRNGKGQ